MTVSHDLSPRIRPSSLGIATLLVTCLFALSACGAPPVPTPSPAPPFASQEEAFAAAEKTYRAYVDAINMTYAGRKGIIPQTYLTGQVLDDDLDSRRVRAEQKIKIIGENSIVAFHGLSSKIDTNSAEVNAEICVDVTGTRAIDASGNDVTPAEKPSTGLLSVTFIYDHDNDRLLISASQLAARTC